MDVRPTLAAAPAPVAPPVIRREDYRAPDWRVPTVELDLDLDLASTRVRARLTVERDGPPGAPLVLDGDGLTPLAVRIDGQPADWRLEDGALVLAIEGNRATVETEVALAPAENTQLMGLYASGGLLCTQCEAEGFRRITFFPDRPDVLSRFDVRMTADATRFPVLLSNGERTGAGTLEGGRHWATWHDPHPKPCYLFALVAGDLQANRDRFATIGGREVELGIWVRAGDVPRTAHAMAALKAAMAWDEENYGREYDLPVFNIVAVDDFNFGAMENKGLNIFNSRYILADPETATDADYDGIAGVVAHEYFHNWSGNRVTCRDWFQLSLKEGFTVFRDQCFMADQGSPAVKRIEEVRVLRAGQFPEDAGPLAHPIRPDSYIEITNFYTATVYAKGAEVIRMMRTLVGPERFRAGCDLYFARHDGHAATCEDFIQAIEDGAHVDLSTFRRWYEQAGTPRLTAELRQEGDTAILTLAQETPPTPGQPTKQPMPIPVRFALFDRSTGRNTGEQLYVLEHALGEVRVEGVQDPVLSINRGFAAPVIVAAERSAADLQFLSAHDDDPFARYEALQQLMLDALIAGTAGRGGDTADAVVTAVGAALDDSDHAFVAEAVTLPSEAFVGDQLPVVDPPAIAAARDALRSAIGRAHANRWRALWEGLAAPYAPTPAAKGARRLRGVALAYLAAAYPAEGAALAERMLADADTMTDRMAALAVLANDTGGAGDRALTAFHVHWRHEPLVLDKWFGVQALSTRPDTCARVAALAQHADFTLANPNRFRALVGAFAANQRAFHAADGAGYRFVADQVIALDPLNGQTAARLVPALGRWRRFDPARQALMRAELERLVARPGVSRDVFEQASKSLAG